MFNGEGLITSAEPKGGFGFGSDVNWHKDCKEVKTGGGRRKMIKNEGLKVF